MKRFALLLPMVASFAFAQQRQGMHYAISQAAIADLLRANGLNVGSSQIHLPMQLRAAVPGPHLEIVQTRRVTGHEVNLELRCQSAGECLPFDVSVDVKDPNTIPIGENRPLSSETTAPKVDQLRVGAQVVLVIVDGRMRIHLPVIAMDNGSKGTLIRVCTLDRKKILRALVVDGETVQGAIE